MDVQEKIIQLHQMLNNDFDAAQSLISENRTEFRAGYLLGIKMSLGTVNSWFYKELKDGNSIPNISNTHDSGVSVCNS